MSEYDLRNRDPQERRFADREDPHAEHATRRDKPNTQPAPEGDFGEEFGDDRGYGRQGSLIEPTGHEQVPGDEYARQMDPSEYRDILLDEEQGRQRDLDRWGREDDRIYSEAVKRLARHGLLASGAITLTVERGEVTLNGVVESREASEAAAAAINEVIGVTGINNYLNVRGENNDASIEALGE